MFRKEPYVVHTFHNPMTGHSEILRYRSILLFFCHCYDYRYSYYYLRAPAPARLVVDLPSAAPAASVHPV